LNYKKLNMCGKKLYDLNVTNLPKKWTIIPTIKVHLWNPYPIVF
jgi:hypothetical protein